METTLLGAGRTTHLKIVVVSLIAAIVVVAVGINAKLDSFDNVDSAVVKAGQPATYAGKDGAAIR